MYLPDRNDLGRLMRSNGLKAAELARRTGVSKGTISKVLRGKVEPGYSTMKLLFEEVYQVSSVNEKTVGEIMTHKVMTVEEGDGIGIAKQKLRENDISQLPILSSSKVVGLVTEKSVLTHPGASVAMDAIVFDFAMVSPNRKVSELSRLIVELQAILVVDHDRLAGIATKADFLR